MSLLVSLRHGKNLLLDFLIRKAKLMATNLHTVAEMVKLNGEYRIKQNTTGHGLQVGDVVRITANLSTGGGNYRQYGGYFTAEGVSPTDIIGVRYNVYGRDLEMPKASRADRLASKKKEISDNEARNVVLKAEIERLEKFKTDEEETAFLLVMASDTASTPADRVAAIAKVLKDRLENKDTTDYI